jgi:hypothetical protein
VSNNSNRHEDDETNNKYLVEFLCFVLTQARYGLILIVIIHSAFSLLLPFRTSPRIGPAAGFPDITPENSLRSQCP